MLAVELRPEERRSPLQDLIGPTQFPDLLLKLPHPTSLGRAHARRDPIIDVSLFDPKPDGFDSVSELRCDPMHRPMLGPQLSSQRPHHPNRSGLLLRRIPTRRRLP